MKRTILLTLTITLSSVALFAQTKKDSTWAPPATNLSRLLVAPDFNLSHPTLSVVAGQQKPVMQIKALSNGKQTDFSGDWDTMVISINKKQIHWLNDSTAVYIKN